MATRKSLPCLTALAAVAAVTAAFLPLRGLLAVRARQRARQAEAGRRQIEELYADLQRENAERQRIEKSLRESELRYRCLMESAPDALVTVGEDGRIRLVNSRTESLFGYSRDELAGQPVEILVPEALRTRHGEHRRAYLAAPRVRPAGCGLELFGQRKDGSRFPVDITLSPWRLQEGLLITAAVRDISERKLLESERQARQSAEAANRAKSRFLANISHELRSPLNTILGFTRLLAQAPELPESVREDLGLVLNSSERLHDLINDVLDLSRLEVGGVAPEEADFDLDRLLAELQALFGPVALGKGLELVFPPRPGVPRHIRSDPGKLRKILVNLIDNAIKFTAAGRVAVGVEAPGAPAADRPERLQFTVADSGPGIPPERLAHLFDPFTQPRTGREYQTGSGLGLAISRGLLQVLGGELAIDSEAGRGTTVRFDLPVRVVAGLAADTARGPGQVVGLVPGQPRYRILVVDDYAEARRLLVRLLSPLGFEVREAADGQEAVDLWRQWQPDLIWMDMRMPVVDGREAARRIRAVQPGPRPVIIALTASSFEGKREEVLAAGCDDFLRKPFPEAKLFGLLEKHLGARFVYAAETAVSAPDAAAVAALPGPLRQALEAALQGLDPQAVEAAIAAVGRQDPELGTVLAAWARDFQYERILALLRPGG